MNKLTYLTKELQALQSRTGASAEQLQQAAEQLGVRVEEEAARNNETDTALVEVGGIAAENAMTAEEIMTALVELAELLG